MLQSLAVISTGPRSGKETCLLLHDLAKVYEASGVCCKITQSGAHQAGLFSVNSASSVCATTDTSQSMQDKLY